MKKFVRVAAVAAVALIGSASAYAATNILPADGTFVSGSSFITTSYPSLAIVGPPDSETVAAGNIIQGTTNEALNNTDIRWIFAEGDTNQTIVAQLNGFYDITGGSYVDNSDRNPVPGQVQLLGSNFLSGPFTTNLNDVKHLEYSFGAGNTESAGAGAGIDYLTAFGSAVPELSTQALMLTGFAGLELAGHRQSKARATAAA